MIIKPMLHRKTLAWLCDLSSLLIHNITSSPITPRPTPVQTLLWPPSAGPFLLLLHRGSRSQEPEATAHEHPSDPEPIILCVPGRCGHLAVPLSLLSDHNNRLQFSRGSSPHHLAIYLSVKRVIIYGPGQLTVVRL